MVIIYGNVLCLIVTAHHICETPAGGTERVRERGCLVKRWCYREAHNTHVYYTETESFMTSSSTGSCPLVLLIDLGRRQETNLEVKLRNRFRNTSIQ